MLLYLEVGESKSSTVSPPFQFFWLVPAPPPTPTPPTGGPDVLPDRPTFLAKNNKIYIYHYLDYF